MMNKYEYIQNICIHTHKMVILALYLIQFGHGLKKKVSKFQHNYNLVQSEIHSNVFVNKCSILNLYFYYYITLLYFRGGEYVRFDVVLLAPLLNVLAKELTNPEFTFVVVEFARGLKYGADAA